jgi:hypothetical protein
VFGRTAWHGESGIGVRKKLDNMGSSFVVNCMFIGFKELSYNF